MEEQIYKISNQESFELKDIFECGQCFIWNMNQDNSYTGVIKNGILNVNKLDENIIFKGFLNDDIKNIVEKYFDLQRDYTNIKLKLANVDEYLKQSIEFGKGIRILNQDLWETIISFIISANNNIPRIKGIIEKLSKKYGKEIIWDNNKYYLFPTPNELENVTIENFRKLGLGFRDKRIFETTHAILENQIDLKSLYSENTLNIRGKLLNLSGVGPKVADCILLFSDLKRFDVFPIDVWVRRVMNELYIKNEDENKASKKEIMDLAYSKFGDLEGIAQQYLFYYRKTM